MAQLLSDAASKTLVRKGKKRLVFPLEAKEYVGNEVHLVCGLKNRSGIDFEVGYLDVLLPISWKRRSHVSVSLQKPPPQHDHKGGCRSRTQADHHAIFNM